MAGRKNLASGLRMDKDGERDDRESKQKERDRMASSLQCLRKKKLRLQQRGEKKKRDQKSFGGGRSHSSVPLQRQLKTAVNNDLLASSGIVRKGAQTQQRERIGRKERDFSICICWIDIKKK